MSGDDPLAVTQAALTRLEAGMARILDDQERFRADLIARMDQIIAGQERLRNDLVAVWRAAQTPPARDNS